MRSAISTIAAVTILAVFVVGCGKQAGDDAGKKSSKTRIALVMKARTNPFFAEMERGAKEAAAKLGVDLQAYAIDDETDAEQQASLVETAIAKGSQAILIAPANSKAIVHPLLQAQAKGIVIINLDNRIDKATADQAGLKIGAFIGPDNVEGAYKSATAMIQAMGGEGGVVMLEGIRGVDNAEARKKGFVKAVEAAGGKVEILAMDTADWASEPALKKMEGMLNTHKDIKGVFCANDMMALGAIRAIDSAGRTGQIVVAAYDNLTAAQGLIRAGKLYATVEQHPARMGALGVEYAVKAIAGEEIPAEIPVETDLVIADNLDLFGSEK